MIIFLLYYLSLSKTSFQNMKLVSRCYCMVMLALLSTLLHTVAQDEEDHPVEILQFVAMGDWGKGGVMGDIQAVSAESLTVTKGVGVLKYEKESTNMVQQLRGYNNDGEPDDEEEDQRDKHDEHDEHDKHDEHRQAYTYQVAVAKGMSNYINSSAYNTSCILALGDNFYDDGVLTSNDSMWTTHWKKVYLQNYTNLRIPWYAIFGNHDYGYGDVGAVAQLDRAKESLDSDDISAGVWQFDSYNYSKCMDIPSATGGTICLIFIDTTTLAPSEERNCNEEGGISTETQAIRIADQLNHIEQMLIDAENSTWVVVCGHYPIFTSGEHGDSSELVTYLQPLIAKYNVSMYLAGHDHLSGHLQYGDTEYFIAGGGAMVDPMGDVRSVATDVWYGVGYAAFSVLQVTSQTLAIKYIHWNGSEMYNYTLRNPRHNAIMYRASDSPSAAPTSDPDTSPGSKSRFHFSPQVSPSLLYIAVAAGSLTGLILSITFFPFDKKRKSKRKKNKKYSSLPPATPRQDPSSTLCSPSVDTHSHSSLSPSRARAGHTSPPSRAGRRSADFPLPPSPEGCYGFRQYPGSPPPSRSPTVRVPFNPFRRLQQGLMGDNLVKRLTNKSSGGVSPTKLGSDHRKTKSEAAATKQVSSPPRLQTNSYFELGV
jgi:tartrate-resistant acid phosphatase type 5